MIYHIVALLAGFIVDLCIGDPYFFPHPVRAIGALIASVERHLLRDAMSDKEKMRAGRILVAIVCTVVFIISTGILITAYYINRYAGCIIYVHTLKCFFKLLLHILICIDRINGEAIVITVKQLE